MLHFPDLLWPLLPSLTVSVFSLGKIHPGKPLAAIWHETDLIHFPERICLFQTGGFQKKRVSSLGIRLFFLLITKDPTCPTCLWLHNAVCRAEVLFSCWCSFPSSFILTVSVQSCVLTIRVVLRRVTWTSCANKNSDLAEKEPTCSTCGEQTDRSTSFALLRELEVLGDKASHIHTHKKKHTVLHVSWKMQCNDKACTAFPHPRLSFLPTLAPHIQFFAASAVCFSRLLGVSALKRRHTTCGMSATESRYRW